MPGTMCNYQSTRGRPGRTTRSTLLTQFARTERSSPKTMAISRISTTLSKSQLEAHSGILPSGRTMIQSGILPMEVSCGPFITSCRPAFRLQTIITFSTTGDDIPFGDVIVEGLQLRDIIVPPLEL